MRNFCLLHLVLFVKYICKKILKKFKKSIDSPVRCNVILRAEKEEGMLKIGELSKLTNVPIKTIRFYEEEGLISPVEVDRWTSYRYYDDASINRLSEIVYLKELGFSLKEIKNLDEKTIKSKLKELNVTLKKIKTNIATLTSFQEGGIMKNFVNDPRVIGKWKRVGVVKTEKDFLAGNFNGNKEVFDFFKEIYFLPNGQEYWTLGWTKGKLFVGDCAYAYKLVNGKMLIFVTDKYNGKVEDILVYEQEDKIAHKEEDIIKNDDINIPFVNDENILGLWNTVDFVDAKNTSKFKTEPTKELYVKRVIADADGRFSYICGEKNHVHDNATWTKGYVLETDGKFSTASKYKIVKKQGATYMILEWKSGDYSYGGQVVGCYVFKKM